MTTTVVSVIDDIHSVDRSADLSLVTWVMVSGGMPLTVAVPVEAVSKLSLLLLDVFRRDGRSLKERRTLAQEEYAMTVSRLQVHDVAIEPPDTPAEPFGLALLLDDGLSVNFCLPANLMANLVAQGQRALDAHKTSKPPQPN